MPHKNRGRGDQSPLILLVDLPPGVFLWDFTAHLPHSEVHSHPCWGSPSVPDVPPLFASPVSTFTSSLFIPFGPLAPVLRDLLQNPTTPCSPPTDWGLGGVGECGIYSVLLLLQVELLATLYKDVRTLYSVNIFYKIT